MEDAITTLRLQRTLLRERLDKIEVAIAEYERWADGVSGLIGPVSQPVDRKMLGTGPEPTLTEMDGPPASSIREFEDAIMIILGEADKPMQRGALMESLDMLGIVVGGKEPANTAATRLSRMSEIVNLKGYGYWLKKRAYSEAGHAKGYTFTNNPNLDRHPVEDDVENDLV